MTTTPRADSNAETSHQAIHYRHSTIGHYNEYSQTALASQTSNTTPLEVTFIAKELKINDQIRVRQVRLIDEEGNQKGIVDTRDALSRAREKDLDLVLVGENAQPPVTKLMDYGKYRYEQQQQEKEARKRSRQQEMKAIKFRVKIDEHDYETKVNHIRRFLKSGHKVRVTIMFRGRERTHPELGQEILMRVGQDVSEMATVESSPTLAGMDMNMVLAPAKEAGKKEEEAQS